ncbi:MAG: T9SS type B sorting domain-containing protein [Flavobacteriaceae bacterium]|nr:T9SS type B sorting domain-containing protein [Flavobacteriaceae bacterium]
MNRLLPILFLLFASSALAQLQSARWYFGHYAGIDFTSGEPVAVYDGQLTTGEGCASIADHEGNLLFYTDGSTVWNAVHEIMENGTGLLGDASSTQSAIIVPVPHEIDKYYILTVGAFDGIYMHDVPEGMHYYIVDMSRNGGLGAVEGFDNTQNFMPGFPSLDRSSEKIAAVKHPNRQDYWVLTHFEDRFYAWLVDENGIQMPVITAIGPFLSTYGYPVNARGYLKISPDGNKIGIAHLSYLTQLTENDYIQNGTLANATPGILAVYDFDAISGVVSNESILNYDASGNLKGSPYGLEFSPNSQFLYAALDYQKSTYPYWLGAELIQYNLATPDFQQNILASSDTFLENDGSALFHARGALQLALDGKIYYSVTRARQNPTGLGQYGGMALSVIANPNLAGNAADYRHEFFQVSPPDNEHIFVSYGLPPFVSSFLASEIIINSDLGVQEACVLENVIFSIDSNSSVVGVEWDFGDGNSSHDLTANHIYTAPGTYWVTAFVTDSQSLTTEVRRQITIHPLPELQDATLYQCDPENDGVALYHLDEAYNLLLANGEISTHHFSFYLTPEDRELEQNSQPTTFYSSADNQILYVLVTNQFGCSSYAELHLETQTAFYTNLPPLAVCDDDFDGLAIFNLALQISNLQSIAEESSGEISFHSSLEDAGNGLHPLSINYSNVIPHRQTIYARMEIDGSCNSIFSFDLIVHPLPVPEIPEIIICPQNDSFTINLTGYLEYEWSGLQGDDALQNLTGPSITITHAGNYRVWVTNEFGCSNATDFVVNFYDLPQITEIEVRNGFTAIVHATGSQAYEYSLDGIHWQNSHIFELTEPGIYRVYVRSGQGCDGNFMEFGILDIPNVITPNADGYNDYWSVPGIAAYPGSVVQIFDRYGKELHRMIIPGDHQSPSLRYVYSTDRLILWDGYYLGRVVNTTSYWYVINLTDGRKYSGWIQVKNY